ncbi:hypothetical protein HUO14_00995 [Parasphingorhabdus flavimaris]|uniref:Argininosuccinate lyase n=1 Tax=Parasphingorhabdus flavimaris TaxID=266812 RepID=A0ABX2MYE2_9SPHN|nr:hypothetical protein [Parasphingorhabdus flavimaris]NVD26474.1 hypothetical protein [Parasphingorhabdus flavimaris]|tara:strand:+ start:18838 stop:19032 length:195 start_codon:yes stop_codon:yes gene_type:complete
MRSFLSALILTGLVACGPAQNDPGPGGVTVGEAKALDEAAEMLDERNLPPESIENPETLPAATD